MAVSSEKKSVIKHNGLTVHFDDSGHVYKVYGENSNGDMKLKFKPISVTTLIHKYQKPFDLEGNSLRVAQREGVSQDEIKARWRTENKRACGYGTKMHTVVERTFNGEFVDDTTFTPNEKVVFSQINKVVGKMKSKPYDWESEKIVFDPEINVAGTIDLLGKNKDTGDYIIVDWKTNKRIRFDNEYGENFLAPIQDLPDCEFNLYGLQLSMYEKILKNGEFIPRDAKVKKFICHFHPVDGVHFHEVDGKFVEPTDNVLVDWKKKKIDAQVQMNADIPPMFN